MVFANLKKIEKSTTDLSITVNEPDKVKITSMALSDEHFSLRQKEGTEEKSGQYEIAFSGSKNIGTIATQLKIALEGSDKPFVEVPVLAIVLGNLNYPRRMGFQKSNDGSTSQNIVISTRDGANVTIAKIEDPDKLLTLKIEKNGTPRITINAEVADPGAKHDQTFKHKLIIHTDDADEPKLEVVYRILDRKTTPIGRQLPQPNPTGKTPQSTPKKP